MEPVYLTPGGLQRLLARIAAAKAAYYEVCADMPAALESGDSSGWHDNFAFEENQRQMHQLAGRVQELEGLLGRVRVVEPLRQSPEQVVVGASVTWRIDDGPPRSAWIAGFGDGDPGEGRISYESPMGRVLLGGREGDVRTARIAGQRRELEIVEIGPSPEGA